MYDNFDSFFDAFKSEISEMNDDEFLRFLEIPKHVLTTFSVIPATFVAPSGYDYRQDFSSEKTIAMCA